MNAGEFFAKLFINLVFKAIVGVVVFYGAQYVLRTIDWKTALALYIAVQTLLKSEVKFR